MFFASKFLMRGNPGDEGGRRRGVFCFLFVSRNGIQEDLPGKNTKKNRIDEKKEDKNPWLKSDLNIQVCKLQPIPIIHS
jgi:hypothetical protein